MRTTVLEPKKFGNPWSNASPMSTLWIDLVTVVVVHDADKWLVPELRLMLTHFLLTVSVFHRFRPFYRPIYYPMHCGQYSVHGSWSSWYESGNARNAQKWKLCKWFILTWILCKDSRKDSSGGHKITSIPIHFNYFSFSRPHLPLRLWWNWWQWVQNITFERAGIYLISS